MNSNRFNQRRDILRWIQSETGVLRWIQSETGVLRWIQSETGVLRWIQTEERSPQMHKFRGSLLSA